MQRDGMSYFLNVNQGRTGFHCQMVSEEPNGLRHILSPSFTVPTLAAAKRTAKAEGCTLRMEG